MLHTFRKKLKSRIASLNDPETWGETEPHVTMNQMRKRVGDNKLPSAPITA